MAPLLETAGQLAKRYYRCDARTGRCYSRWDSWGRWVFAAIVIAGIIFVALCLSCINSRRRRRRGQTPLYGTGWLAPKYGPPPSGAAPPQYSARPNAHTYTGSTYHPPPQGYYGSSGNPGGPPGYGANGYGYGAPPADDIPLQHPQHAYHPREQHGDFSPPPGPPPNKPGM